MSPKALVFGYPKLVKAGLGHMLGAWGRCFLWCRQSQSQMIAPKWFQFRIGPYLRNEKDKRQYHKFFHSNGYIDGIWRLWLLGGGEKATEAEFDSFLWSKRTRIKVFYEDTGFSELNGHHEILRNELIRITRPVFLHNAVVSEPAIGVHVRRGDFSTPVNSSVISTGKKNVQIPIEWYLDAIRTLRSDLGKRLPVRLFSDGDEDDLRPLLLEGEVILMPNRAAITDLFTMSQSNIFIGSGSGFSQWAAFLGQMPTIWHPGQRLERVLDASTSNVDLIEVEWNNQGQTLPDVFIEEATKSIARPNYFSSSLNNK